MHGAVAHAVTRCTVVQRNVSSLHLYRGLLTLTYHSLAHSLTQPSPLSHHLLQTPKKTPTTPSMEKNSVVTIVASKATGEETLVLVQAPVEASKAATVPVQTSIPTSAVAASEEAPVLEI